MKQKTQTFYENTKISSKPSVVPNGFFLIFSRTFMKGSQTNLQSLRNLPILESISIISKLKVQILYLALYDSTQDSKHKQNNEEHKQDATHHSEIPLKKKKT